MEVTWMTKGHLPQVLAIEATTDHPSTEAAMLGFLNQRDHIGGVAVEGDVVTAYTLYVIRPRHIEVVSLVVSPVWRLQGTGRLIVEALSSRLNAHRRNRLVAHVRADNLDGHLFLKKTGWRATGTVPANVDSDERYTFQRWYPDLCEAPVSDRGGTTCEF